MLLLMIAISNNGNRTRPSALCCVAESTTGFIKRRLCLKVRFGQIAVPAFMSSVKDGLIYQASVNAAAQRMIAMPDSVV